MSRRGLSIPGVAVFVLVALAGRARAWNADGHKTVATIADKMIAGTNAANQVSTILDGTSLEDASVWADCVKGVVASDTNPPTFSYQAGKFPECVPFETKDGEAAMIDFVSRNYRTCNPRPGEEDCHRQYHYSDIPIAKATYSPAFFGARPDDVETAISVMIGVLQGQTAPAPFSIKDKREALLLLIHYVGDIHQPLHVGAIYLDAAGHRVNPDAAHYDLTTDTHGGNNISLGTGKNLHGTWDAVPDDFKASNVNDGWLADANKIAKTPGAIGKWSTAWATASQNQAQHAFKGLIFGSRWDVAKGKDTLNTWSATLPSAYDATMTAIKKTQLTAGGAHLGQLLKALWP
jgi:hypothetical protein